MQAWSLAATRDPRIVRTLSEAIRDGILTEKDSPISAYGHTGLQYDMFTDCIAMGTNLGNEDVPLLERVAATPYVSSIRNGVMAPCKSLVHDIQAGSVRAEQQYARYWHGHQIYLRPLLANTSLANIHVLNAMLLCAAVSFFVVQMVRRFGLLGAPLVLVPLAMGTNILTTPASTVHVLTWIWAFSSVGFMAYRFATHEITSSGTLGLVFSAGCIAAFFDILFSPPFAPTLMAFLAIGIGVNRGPSQGATARAVCQGMAVAFVWFAGFSLAWISKWVFSTAVLGWDVVSPYLLDAIKVRSFGDGSIDRAKQVLFGATQTAFTHQNQTLMIWAAVIALAIAGIAVICGARKRSLAGVAALMTPLVIPIIWVEVLRDHSVGHPHFAARSFVLFAIIPLLAAWSICRRQISPWIRIRAVLSRIGQARVTG